MKDGASAMLNQALRDHFEVVSLHGPDGMPARVFAMVTPGPEHLDLLRTKYLPELNAGGVLIVWVMGVPRTTFAAPRAGKAVQA